MNAGGRHQPGFAGLFAPFRAIGRAAGLWGGNGMAGLRWGGPGRVAPTAATAGVSFLAGGNRG